MAKKSFTNQSKDVIAKKQEKIERPIKNSKPLRTTLYVIPDKYEKIKDIAYWDRTTVTDLTDQAFTLLIEKYEKEHGPIKMRPEGK